MKWFAARSIIAMWYDNTILMSPTHVSPSLLHCYYPPSLSLPHLAPITSSSCQGIVWDMFALAFNSSLFTLCHQNKNGWVFLEWGHNKCISDDRGGIDTRRTELLGGDLVWGTCTEYTNTCHIKLIPTQVNNTSAIEVEWPCYFLSITCPLINVELFVHICWLTFSVIPSVCSPTEPPTSVVQYIIKR